MTEQQQQDGMKVKALIIMQKKKGKKTGDVVSFPESMLSLRNPLE